MELLLKVLALLALPEARLRQVPARSLQLVPQVPAELLELLLKLAQIAGDNEEDVVELRFKVS